MLRRPTSRGSRRRGFTLTEVMCVVSIFGLLAGVFIPAIQSAREAARQLHCANNFAQLGVALQNYEHAHDVLPPGVVDTQGPVPSTQPGYDFGWAAHILPMLEQDDVYRRLDFTRSVHDPANTAIVQSAERVIQCPSSVSAYAEYVACYHDVEAPIDVDNHGVFFLNSSVRSRRIRDGLVHTIFLGESLPPEIRAPWLSGTGSLRNTNAAVNSAPPNWIAGDRQPGVGQSATMGGFGSQHDGGAQFLFGDGAVRLLSEKMDLDVLRRLAHRYDGGMLDGF